MYVSNGKCRRATPAKKGAQPRLMTVQNPGKMTTRKHVE